VISCFVASALDYEDVDEVYDRAVKPTLRQLGIRSMRVDRVEHNDDVDDKIFALMETADFCIADLTYARPSVYYEAGYMFGQGKPVIYIARRDHFCARDSDPHGNLRVHFDLQMKNIIAWSAATNVFALKLKRRISKVVAPVLKARRTAQEHLQHEQAFVKESVSVQLSLLRRFAGGIFRARGFSERSELPREFYIRPRRLLAMTRRRKRIHQTINFLPIERLTKSQAIPEWALSFFRPDVDRNVQKIERLFLYATLKKITDAAVRSIFERLTPLEPFILERRFDRSVREDEDEPPTTARVAVLSGVRSVPEFKQRLKTLLSKLDYE
jgi:nucleoside 2-deoxyribosyltransferase